MWFFVFVIGGLFLFFIMGFVLCGGSFVVGIRFLFCLILGDLVVDVGILLVFGDVGNKFRLDLIIGVLIIGVGGVVEVVWFGKWWNYCNL